MQSIPYESAKETISTFLHELRRKRHNQLINKKKKGELLEREDRVAWPLTTILYAFKQEKIDGFKQFMEEINTGRVKEWDAKWTAFVGNVKSVADDDSKKKFISKFLANMRVARYNGTQKN